MKHALLVVGCTAMLASALAADRHATVPQPSAPTSNDNKTASASIQRAILDRYCVVCHNTRSMAAGLEPARKLTLDQLDLTHVGENAQVWEKVVRRLRAGMMPPSGARRPDAATRDALVEWLENELDRSAVTHVPPPGLHRLNRTEYANVIRDLLALNVDAAKFLPPDDSTHGFDNMAGTLGMSPALLEAYMSAAGKVSRLAVGDVTAQTQTVYRVPEDTSQDYHIEGLPFGTRGGILIKHEVPADGWYVFKVFPVNLGNMDNNRAFGEVTGEKLEVLVDGEQVHLFDWDKELGRGPAVHGGAEARVWLTAGLHSMGVTFVATNYAPGNDLNRHFLRATLETGGLPGFTFYPHVGKVRIDGPFEPAGAGNTPSRQKIFVCRPSGTGAERDCARRIVSTLARRAFRRPATDQDVASLMEFYQQGRQDGSFDRGIEMALRRLLADPEFIYRKEAEPAGMAPGTRYRISDLELASRLSFFLWSSMPDDTLIDLASREKLRDPAILERQVRRMLTDPRSEALVTNFAGQWLNLRGLQSQVPVPFLFPDFDDNLREAMRRETELFFDSIVREDRSIIDLLTADHTFVNERLARHYGIPNIYGSQFRRVALGNQFDMRRGLLGKAALLAVSSQPGRTSPVQRGKWFLQTFLGVSPPDPPPNVPDLKPKKHDATGNVKDPTMREQMEAHRAVEPCASCHKIMDPIGFSLENFDAVGAWRTDEGGTPIDASGQLVDGTRLDGPASLRQALLHYSDQYVRTVIEKLLTYAIGRGVEYFDMPVVRSIVRNAAPGNYRFSSLVIGIVKSAPFQMNMKAEPDGQRPQGRKGSGHDDDAMMRDPGSAEAGHNR
jgi:hypothetical protein